MGRSQRDSSLTAAAVLILVILAMELRQPVLTEVLARMNRQREFSVVIDAGHGGMDPGKVGVNQALEKNINLEIALHLKRFLEANDVNVIMTRTQDTGLYEEDSSQKKLQDMKKRVEIISLASPDLAVSIHQNSYPQEQVRGAQVFYHKGSEAGRELAEQIQHRLIEDIDPGNTRQVKADDSYYLLKHTACPTVIVECGFLSNEVEAEMLCDPGYQEKVAWAIHLGILQYKNR